MKDILESKKKEFAKIVAQAWVDDDFKQKLLTSPREVLKEAGIDFPEDLTINIIEGKPNQVNVVLPAKPDEFSGGLEEIKERLAATTATSTGWA